MTPKEKAGELIKKYAIKLPTQYNNRIDETSGVKIWDYNIDLAKQCALITVDEILKAIPDSLLDVWKGETYLCINDDIDYWKKVKQEIEKL